MRRASSVEKVEAAYVRAIRGEADGGRKRADSAEGSSDYRVRARNARIRVTPAFN